MTPGKWRKASRSGGNGGNCVEVRAWTDGGPVEVRDSKAPTLGSLAISSTDFAALKDSLKLEHNPR